MCVGGRFMAGKNPVRILKEAEWSQVPVWTGVKNLSHTRIWTKDRPPLGVLLLWLSTAYMYIPLIGVWSFVRDVASSVLCFCILCAMFSVSM
jgi:hypothetical protein